MMMNQYSCLGTWCDVPIPYFTILTLRTRPQSVWAHLKSAAPDTWPQRQMHLKYSMLCTKPVQLKPTLQILYNLQIALLAWHWWRCCWCPGVPVIVASTLKVSQFSLTHWQMECVVLCKVFSNQLVIVVLLKKNLKGVVCNSIALIKKKIIQNYNYTVEKNVLKHDYGNWRINPLIIFLK